MGDQIIYIPNHVDDGDGPLDAPVDHPDVEAGFVTGTGSAGKSYFCRYWSKTFPGTLRTMANSELTPASRLRRYDTVAPAVVRGWLRKLGYLKRGQ